MMYRHRFEAMKDPDWFCQTAFAQPNDRRIVIEVGGKVRTGASDFI